MQARFDFQSPSDIPGLSTIMTDDGLQNRCPNLQTFELDHHFQDTPLSGNEILGFLWKMPSLKDISLGVEHCMELCSAQLFKHLAQRPTLNSLQICLNPKSDSELLSFLEQTDTPIFSNMRNLKISSSRDSRLCTALFSHLTNLRFLEVNYSLDLGPDDFSLSLELDPCDRFFAQLPPSPELDHLGVEFRIRYDIRPTSWYLRLPGSALIRLAEKYSTATCVF
jgi:hypothetical protein